MHFQAYINPADQFTVNIHLRVGGPLGVLLETLPHLLILEYVKMSIFQAIILRKKIDHLLRKPTSSLFRGALHKDHDLFLGNQTLQTSLQGFLDVFWWEKS